MYKVVAKNSNRIFLFDDEMKKVLEGHIFNENDNCCLYNSNIESVIALAYGLEKIPEGLKVNYVNGNKWDCRECNLKLVAKDGGKTSKSANVSWQNREKKWLARLYKHQTHNGKVKHLGLFDDEDIAIQTVRLALGTEMLKYNLKIER